MDRKVIKHLSLVPLEQLKKESEKLEKVANESAAKYIDEILNPPEKPQMNPIPKNVSTILGVIATAGLAVAQFVPAPWGTLVSIIAFVLGGVAGMALKAPTFLAGKPVLQGSAVAVLASGVPLAASAASSTTGWLQLIASAVALILAFLTGTAAPQLGNKPAEPPPAP
jgi:hypothetical protein